VFDMFAQIAGPQQAKDSGGLGIGLNIVKRLVHMHHGTIEGHSDGIGKGSEFIVRLPLETAVENTPPTEEMNKTTSGSPRRVLVVDDNQDAADSLAWLLRLDGHEVDTAYSAADALEHVAGRGADVVLLDIGLPRMDGYEVARRIRAGGAPQAAPRLLALTGYGQPEDRERALASGFDGHLVKPVDLDALRQALAEA
jgi:CheY-like chemotaxis protein